MKNLLSPSRLCDDSSTMDLDYFVKTIRSMSDKGVRPDLIGSIVTHYATKWLPDLSPVAEPSEKSAPLSNNPSARHDSSESPITRWTRKRMCVEAVVGVLPSERGAVTCDFLLRLLRMGNMLGAEESCRDELEKRVTWQLDQASLKELLIPSFSHTCGTLLDVALLLRLVKGFMKSDEAVLVRSGAALAKVAKLVDCYLAEAAIDSNLSSSEFLALAGALPDHARSNDDRLYRAVDTYFKAHPGLPKQEKKTMCQKIDSRKLSHEAGLHAIQNERLPVRTIISIMFSEQAKLHSRLDWGGSFNGSQGPGYLTPDQTVRCQSMREMTQRMELKKLRNDVVRLERQCATMHGQMEMTVGKEGYCTWKRIGMAALKRVGGGGDKIEAEGEFGWQTPAVVVKTKSAKARTSNKCRRSVS